jgi:hypothetical protein
MERRQVNFLNKHMGEMLCIIAGSSEATRLVFCETYSPHACMLAKSVCVHTHIYINAHIYTHTHENMYAMKGCGITLQPSAPPFMYMYFFSTHEKHMQPHTHYHTYSHFRFFF